MGERKFSRDTHHDVRKKVEAAGGDTSFAGRQKIKDTGKLHPLVDPAGYELIRRSLPRFAEKDGVFILTNGVPMLIETLGDTTGSMGENIKLMFDSLPELYDFLTKGKYAVFGRYDPQVMNAIFGDVVDNFILARTQAEMDEKISEQLTLMVPEHHGGDDAEDPEYGLFGAAYLTNAFINQYGLKYYHFTVTDAPSHGRIDRKNLVRVFGETVFDKVKENCQIDFSTGDLPETKEIVDKLKKQAHAFMILVGDNEYYYWERIYGQENILVIDSTDILPYIQATVIGLTEGIFDLNFVVEYLNSIHLNKSDAIKIQRAVANIPLGAQTLFDNFDKIPTKGSVFTQKSDLWPTDQKNVENEDEASKTKWL